MTDMQDQSSKEDDFLEGAGQAGILDLDSIAELHPLRGRDYFDRLRQLLEAHGQEAADRRFLLDGRYYLRELVGSGGFGHVWRADDRVEARTVAVKVVYPENELHRQIQPREIRALEALDHPRIVALLDHGRTGDGGQYLVMPLVDGRPLVGPVEPDEAVRQAISLARTLEHAHGQGVLHRDLKPDNVLLGPDGEPVLIDFGVARLLDTIGCTRTGNGGGGTPGYMAPEQLEGKTEGPATDVFGLGGVLHFLLTGQPPPRDGSPLDPSIPTGLRRVLVRALLPRAAERHASAAEMAEDLENVAATRSRGRRVALAVLGLVAVGTLVLLAGRDRGDPPRPQPPAPVVDRPVAPDAVAAVPVPPAPIDRIVDLADVDGDRRLDLVSIAAAGPVVVRCGLAEGALGEAVSTDLGPGVGGATGWLLADVDGDGRHDLLRLAGRRVEVYRAAGGGRFEPAAIASDLAGVEAVDVLQAADIDGDGRSDLVAARVEPAGDGDAIVVRVYRGRSDARLQAVGPAVELATGLPSPSGLAVRLADLDGDRAADLVGVRAVDRADGDALCSVVFLSRDGSFDGQPRLSRLDRGDYGSAGFRIELADVGGDGRLDLVATRVADSYPEVKALMAVVFAGDGDGTFASRPVASYLDNGPYASGGFAARVADIDGDGRADFVATRAVDDGSTEGLVGVVYRGQEDRTFVQHRHQSFLAGGPLGSLRTAVLLGDVDGDGAADLVAASRSGAGEERLCLALGDGRFGRPRIDRLPADPPFDDLPPGFAWAGVNEQGFHEIVRGAGSGDLDRIEGHASRMIWIPPGESYLDASSPEADRFEEGFFIDRYEVASGQFAACERALGREPGEVESGDPLRAASRIAWADAVAYVGWVGDRLPEGWTFRLPTLTEWRRAARGPNRFRVRPWGEDRLDQPAPLRPGRVMRVHSLRAGASWCGAQHLAGNVKEWAHIDVGRETPWPETLLGGGWRDPAEPPRPGWPGRGEIDVVDEVVADDPEGDRDGDRGFRCVLRRR